MSTLRHAGQEWQGDVAQGNQTESIHSSAPHSPALIPSVARKKTFFKKLPKMAVSVHPNVFPGLRFQTEQACYNSLCDKGIPLDSSANGDRHFPDFPGVSRIYFSCGSAVVSTAMFGVPPNIFLPECNAKMDGARRKTRCAGHAPGQTGCLGLSRDILFANTLK